VRHCGHRLRPQSTPPRQTKPSPFFLGATCAREGYSYPEAETNFAVSLLSGQGERPGCSLVPRLNPKARRSFKVVLGSRRCASRRLLLASAQRCVCAFHEREPRARKPVTHCLDPTLSYALRRSSADRLINPRLLVRISR
jgi:hypothetical protein